VASAGTSTVTVLRTFLRFLQARVEVAAAVVLVLEVVTLTAVLAVPTLPVNKHLQLLVSWETEIPGMAELEREL
jgi:hypothetical protein